MIESVIKLFADDTSVSLALNDPNRRATLLILTWRKLTAGRNNGKLAFLKKKTELLTFKKHNHPVFTHCHLEILFSKTRNVTNI